MARYRDLLTEADRQYLLKSAERADKSAFGHIQHPLRRAYLEVYAILGHAHKSAEAIGIHPSIVYTHGWREDAEFQDAMVQARAMAGDSLELEARRRAVDGTRQYKFDKYGRALRHPEQCECGHELRRHARPSAEDHAAILAEDGKKKRGNDQPPPEPARPCLECDCTAFFGAPYYEHAWSDYLLGKMLEARFPDYRKHVSVRSTNVNLDMSQLPNEIVAGLAAGLDPRQVVAAYMAKVEAKQVGTIRALPPSREPNDDGSAGNPG